MSGGGRASYFPTKPGPLRDLIRQTAEDTEQKRLESSTNDYLQNLLVSLNQRDSEKVQKYVDDIRAVLGEEHEIEKFLFGGSVAKHTFVDGLSDIDALVVLKRADLEGKNPREVLKSFFDTLHDGLTRDLVVTLDKGNLAVTVRIFDASLQ
jgi:predicted nucleotidyltransferase